MNRELKKSKVKKWLDANRLSLNIAKTNFAIFRSKPKNLMNLSEINLDQSYSPVLSVLNTLEFLLTLP